MNWGEMNSIRGCDINRHCALFLLSCIDLRISGRVGGGLDDNVPESQWLGMEY